MKPWMVVSFHTPDELYRNHAAGLKESLEKFSIPHHIVELSPQEDWTRSCGMKALFIDAMLEMFPGVDIVWLDADARVRQYPALFDTIDKDFAAHWMRGVELLSGTLFFKNSPGAKEIVKKWVREQECFPAVWDQKTLASALRDHLAQVYELPAPYTLIFDSMKKLGPPVIEHLQASRTVRKAMARVPAKRILPIPPRKKTPEPLQAHERVGSGAPMFEMKYPNAMPASLLHQQCQNVPGVVFGNSSSLKRTNMGALMKFYTVGCNRILSLFKPDYYIVVDRDPYRQDIGLIEKYKGTRVLSSTIYNEKTICHRVPVQPIPSFPFYYFRCVSATIRVQTDWSQPVLGAGNISFPMLQLAIMLGMNPIGIAGVDLVYKSAQDSHFFGNGRNRGCRPINPVHSLYYFRATAQWCKAKGIQVYNLSPEGVLNCFERMSADEFSNRFAKQAPGAANLCPREFTESAPPKSGWPKTERIVYRGKPNPPLRTPRPYVPPGRGQSGGQTRSTENQAITVRSAALVRNRNARRAAILAKQGLLVGTEPQAPAGASVQAQLPSGQVPPLGEHGDLRDRGGSDDGGK